MHIRFASVGECLKNVQERVGHGYVKLWRVPCFLNCNTTFIFLNKTSFVTCIGFGFYVETITHMNPKMIGCSCLFEYSIIKISFPSLFLKGGGVPKSCGKQMCDV